MPRRAAAVLSVATAALLVAGAAAVAATSSPGARSEPAAAGAARPAASAGRSGSSASPTGATPSASRATARAGAPGRLGAHRTAAATAPAGMPSNVPPAAVRPEPALPVPHGWPFADAFPRTSGTSRLVGGALEWSDFVYDDHGAQGGVPGSFPIAGLSPASGTYGYPAGSAYANNGADIFRVGIGRDAGASYWRVDWNTLVDPSVPIVEFAIDRDGDPATGVSQWAAGAGISSPGIDHAIVVSSRGAWLIDLVTGARTALPAPVVDTVARSFVVRVPSADLPPTGTSVVRVAAGLATATGDAFAPVPPQNGNQLGRPPVYNVGFRSVQQEPAQANYWMDSAQAAALAQGDVSPFAATVDWAKLSSRTTTPEPVVTGYSNRWYVSSIELGQGVVPDAGYSAGDLRPNFLGRVQPYAVYVPASYDGTAPAPLTWLLHSLAEQHNQYGALDPSLLQQACEDRHSICATTLGRGPDGWYYDEAELDFWEVWNRLAGAYRLDPERTVISGYSMGGWASYKLGLSHPDLFAKAVVLAGPPACGAQLATGYGFAAGPGRCTTDGQAKPLVANGRWLPYYIAHGTNDELVPVSSVAELVKAFDDAGNRYRFELYPGQDHVAWAVEGQFPSAAEHMGTGTRTTNPPSVDLTWYPSWDNPQLGLGTTGAYWLGAVAARSSGPGSLAHASVASAARPEAHTVARTPGVVVPGQPTPGLVAELTWVAAPPPARAASLTASLTNVAAATIDLAGAGFAPAEPGTATVDTDGTTSLTLVGATSVALDGGTPITGAAVTVPAGHHTLTFA